MGGRGGYGGSGGGSYGGGRGGYGGGGGGMQRNQDNSVFVGGLGEVRQSDVEQIFLSNNLTPARVRVLTDETGKSKGAAFVDFADPYSA